MMADLFTSVPKMKSHPPTELGRKNFEMATRAYITLGSAYLLPWIWEGLEYINTGACYPGDVEERDEASMIRCIALTCRNCYPETLTEKWVADGQKHPDDEAMWYDGIQVEDKTGRWWLLVGPERVFYCKIRRKR